MCKSAYYNNKIYSLRVMITVTNTKTIFIVENIFKNNYTLVR